MSCDPLQDADCASLWARLRTFEARPVLANQWTFLRGFLHERDRIVVTEVGAERASRRALSNLTEL